MHDERIVEVQCGDLAFSWERSMETSVKVISASGAGTGLQKVLGGIGREELHTLKTNIQGKVGNEWNQMKNFVLLERRIK